MDIAAILCQYLPLAALAVYVVACAPLAVLCPVVALDEPPAPLVDPAPWYALAAALESAPTPATPEAPPVPAPRRYRGRCRGGSIAAALDYDAPDTAAPCEARAGRGLPRGVAPPPGARCGTQTRLQRGPRGRSQRAPSACATA